MLSESLDRFGMPIPETKKDGKTSWSWKDEIESTGKPGDILLVTDGKTSGHILYIPDSGVHGGGFHYVGCDEHGNFDEYERIQHSNMLFKQHELKIVGHKDIKKHEYKGLFWFELGNEKLDAQLSNLDDRMALWKKYATPHLKEIYSDQEARNFHQENGEMVMAFAEHMEHGGSPAAFSVDGVAQ
jgi:hypothetical protein